MEFMEWFGGWLPVSLCAKTRDLIKIVQMDECALFFFYFYPVIFLLPQRYYKVSPSDGNAATHSSSTNLAGSSSAAASTSHLCEECVQRQQSMDPSAARPSHEEQLLIAPAIVVELPTYDEAIAEDS